jgi:hypothetical protein
MPENPDILPNGAMAARISNAAVQILHQYTGSGPTKARTDISHDSVVVPLAYTLTNGSGPLSTGASTSWSYERDKSFTSLCARTWSRPLRV